MARALRLATVVVGAALVAALVAGVGVPDDLRRLPNLVRVLAAAIGFELLVDACHTRGWRATLAPHRLGFWRLYWIRQAGTAINQLTPTATLGGETVKAMLLRPRVGGIDAVASLFAARASFALAQAALVLLGCAALLERVRGAPALAATAAGIAGFAGVLGFVAVQRRGMVTAAVRLARRIAPRRPAVERLATRAAALDTRLAAFHHDQPGAFARSVAWHFAGQLTGVVQLVAILRGLGVAVAPTTALALEAFAVTVDAATFFVPARIGVQEGGRVLVFTTLGFDAATGLAVGLAVRAGQLAAVALGLAAFGYFSLRRTTPLSTAG